MMTPSSGEQKLAEGRDSMHLGRLKGDSEELATFYSLICIGEYSVRLIFKIYINVVILFLDMIHFTMKQMKKKYIIEAKYFNNTFSKRTVLNT